MRAIPVLFLSLMAACASDPPGETQALSCGLSIDDLCRGIVPCYRSLDELARTAVCREMTQMACDGYVIVERPFIEGSELRFYRDGDLVAVTSTAGPAGPVEERCTAGASTFARPLCEAVKSPLCD